MEIKNVGCDKQVIDLKRWLKRSGCSTKSFHLCEFPETGRGLKACHRFPRESVLISIPKELLVFRETAARCLAHLESSIFTTQELLSLFLLEEKAKLEQSSWHPYLKTLPVSYEVPFFHSPEEQLLLPVHLAEQAKSQKLLIQQVYDRLCKQNVFSNSTSLDQFAWAWFTVNTRAVYIPATLDQATGMALAPYLDMFNHSFRTSVRVQMTGDCYQLITEEDVERNNEAFISYGPHDNIKLWLEYGFVLANNPHDLIPITGSDLTRCLEKTATNPVSNLVQKLALLERNKYLCNMGYAQNGFTWNVLASLVILKMKNIKNWRKVLTENITESSLAIEIKHLKDQLWKNLNTAQVALKSRSRLTPNGLCTLRLITIEKSMLE